MRAGIQRLATIITADFGGDPTDGMLYVFISRKADKAKMLRFDTSGWLLYCCTLCEGTFKWRCKDQEELLTIEPRQLLWLLDGLETQQPKAAKKVTKKSII